MSRFHQGSENIYCPKWFSSISNNNYFFFTFIMGEALLNDGEFIFSLLLQTQWLPQLTSVWIDRSFEGDMNLNSSSPVQTSFSPILDYFSVSLLIFLK